MEKARATWYETFGTVALKSTELLTACTFVASKTSLKCPGDPAPLEAMTGMLTASTTAYQRMNKGRCTFVALLVLKYHGGMELLRRAGPSTSSEKIYSAEVQ